ncbi:MAG: Glucoamylase, intracellular sporulation-specific [Thelocarpon impressellum]|nr:MAG: Glucoamylase, intracellular sporulation-specific [Thelocarpon impressellum]
MLPFQFYVLLCVSFSRIADAVTQLQRPLLKDLLPDLQCHPQDSLDAWLSNERDFAVGRLLANAAPGGHSLQGAVPGTVVASPSRRDPDYYYQWVRDAAITVATLVRLESESYSPRIEKVLSAYASLQRDLQRASDLGEPKFLVSGKPFTGPWGRPQRDGPALRALTLMHYLRQHNSTNPAVWHSTEPTGAADWFRRLYEPVLPAESIIKADLEYVSHSWRLPGFDLWEEFEGFHFFTAVVQMRAMREGAELAAAFGDVGASSWYHKQHLHLRDLVGKFWDAEHETLVATLNSSRSGLDCSILLGALHGADDFDQAAFDYRSWSDEVLLSLLKLAQDQRDRFPINSAFSHPLFGTGLGRYPEDIYDGCGTSVGNPWFLCTASAAELLYRAALHFKYQGSIRVSSLGLPFWHALNPHITRPCVLTARSHPSFHVTLELLVEAADGFLAVIRRHADDSGALSEQFDGVTGMERGARDLTWSYGAFIEAVAARDAFVGV